MLFTALSTGKNGSESENSCFMRQRRYPVDLTLQSDTWCACLATNRRPWWLFLPCTVSQFAARCPRSKTTRKQEFHDFGQGVIFYIRV